MIAGVGEEAPVAAGSLGECFATYLLNPDPPSGRNGQIKHDGGPRVHRMGGEQLLGEPVCETDRSAGPNSHADGNIHILRIEVLDDEAGVARTGEWMKCDAARAVEDGCRSAPEGTAKSGKRRPVQGKQAERPGAQQHLADRVEICLAVSMRIEQRDVPARC